ncbi:glycosyltransferase family A protein [Methanolobus sp.]|jgi:glycosyltransferase involved in cell wall biosynthesis|uniref:glycosyltransferase family 2 protein n=1 Tax=Methanolobus sp. TaxID=1874737 RepID=UPI0025E93CDC|nr:glycosyltransferase family A protein [Methanolobus sp.]
MYILITPAKNEEVDLPSVADSVINQTIRPLIWLIVDDGSTDNTPDIIEGLKQDHSWIRSIKLPPKPRDITFHVAYVYKEGFDNIIRLCDKENIQYDYIASLDSDSIIEPEYFEKLINELKANPKLGIVSGGIYEKINGKLEWRKSNETIPSGSGRIWNKTCYFETGGYTGEPSSDSISNTKALIKGWETKQLKNVVLAQTRLTSSAEGLWKGYKANGFMAYYVNKHPLLFALTAMNLICKKPYYLFIPYSYGYLSSWIKKEKKVEDEEVRKYHWETRLNEYKIMFMNKLKGSRKSKK